MLLAGPLSALAWSHWTAYLAWRAEQAAIQTQPQLIQPFNQSSATIPIDVPLYAVDAQSPESPRLLPTYSLENSPAPMPN